MSVIEVEGVETTIETPVVTEADIYERAADLLEEFGWCQGQAGSKLAGEFCAIGAMQEAAEEFGLVWWEPSGPFISAAMRLGKPRSAVEIWPLAVWNDEPGRTKSEVVAKLREAAKAARA